MEKKLISLQGGEKKNDLKVLLRQMQNDLETFLEYHETSARLYKHKFDVLIKNGFTKEEALELCKVSFL